MSKVQVSYREFEALDLFLKNTTKENAIKMYINYEHTFTCEYAPLKDIGLERFVSAVINGYEWDVNFSEDGVEVSFNYGLDYVFECEDNNKDFIYLGVTKPYGKNSIGLTIKKAQFLADSLNSIIEIYNKNKKGE